MKKIIITLSYLVLSLPSFAGEHSLRLECEITTNKGFYQKKEFNFNPTNGYVTAIAIKRDLIFLNLTKLNRNDNSLAFWIGREGADGIMLNSIDGIKFSDITVGLREEFNIKWRLGLIKLKMNCLFLSKE